MGQSINVYIQHQLYDWAEDGFICFHMYIYCIQTQETCLKLWVHTFPMLWIFLWVRYSTLEKDIGFQFVYRPFGVDIQNIWMTYGSMDWFKGKSYPESMFFTNKYEVFLYFVRYINQSIEWNIWVSYFGFAIPKCHHSPLNDMFGGEWPVVAT